MNEKQDKKDMGEMQFLVLSSGWQKLEGIIRKQISAVMETLPTCKPEELIPKQVEIRVLRWILGKVDELLAKEMGQ